MSSTKPQYLPQPQSPLLGRLPFEIRRMIWTSLLHHAPKSVHIVRCRDKATDLQYIVCREGVRPTFLGWNCCKFCVNAARRKEMGWGLEYGRFCGLKRPFGDLVAVGRTCSFAYAETSPHIYSAGTFIFANATNFLHFNSAVRAGPHCHQHHQHIRSVKIYWNLAGDFFVGDEEDFLIQLSVLCDVARGLSGLRRFVILMPPVHWYGREDMVARVLAPLESLRCAWELSMHLSIGEGEKQVVDLGRVFGKLGWRGAVGGYRLLNDYDVGWVIQVLGAHGR
ncbi:conserved hypothetical protein [Histoplasma capsulatum var. duboisii H88]|uniref:DUF7730 domain-containing protein n=2 Tax=Ajellomyces capsulatus (strain H88) TaxID=544711 RepID=F0U9W8_AJEC8|nr:conserved hypothetical protein [Histoplasma capsulatum var. duboisii H88]